MFEHEDLSIAIIGAGMAGLAAAALLAKKHRVTVFERVEQPHAVGAGILLQPSGMQVLAQMHMLNPVMNVAARIDRLYGTLRDQTAPRHRNGWPIMDMRYADFSGNSYGLGLSRHALFNLLLAQSQAAGVRLITGASIAQIEQNDSGVQVHVSMTAQSDAQPPSAATTRSAGRFDLAIVANGTFSHLRESVGIAHTFKPYPWGALWTLLPDVAAAVPGTLRQWYQGAHQMLGLLPTGRHGAEQLATPPWISLFWSEHSDRVDALRAQPLQQWKDKALRLTPVVEPYLAQITDWSQLAWARYADVRMKQPYHGNIMFIGDAAHAMSPQLGQGTNMALIDAWVLAHALGCSPLQVDAPKPNTSKPFASNTLQSAIAQAFSDYALQRKAHLRFYQWASKWLTPVFQSDSTVVPWLRNAVFWPSSRLPLSREQAALVLTGYKQGLLWGQLKLPPSS